MKKTILCLTLFLLALAGFAFGDEQNGNSPILIGFNGTYSGFNWKISASDSLNQELSALCGGVFLDFTYLRIGSTFGYLFNYKLIYQNGSYRDETILSAASGYFIDVYAMLKATLKISPAFNFWPTAGVLYSIALKLDFDGNGTNDIASQDTPNDWYIMAGAGMDFKFGKFILTPSVLYGANLTPTQTTASLPYGVSAGGGKLVCNLGFAFKI
jgi:hypothetical protein